MQRVWHRMLNYNAFTHEGGGNDEEDDDDDNESRDTATILKHQLYATRLYVILLICK